MAGTSGGVLDELDAHAACGCASRFFLSPAGATPPSIFLSPPELHPSGHRRDGRREREQAGPHRFDGCSTEGERKIRSAAAQVRRSSSAYEERARSCRRPQVAARDGMKRMEPAQGRFHAIYNAWETALGSFVAMLRSFLSFSIHVKCQFLPTCHLI
jgi:hypothetical protein